MKQIEFDAVMQQMHYEQRIANEKYNAQKETMDAEINDLRLQILSIRSRIQEVHIKKMNLQAEQKRMNLQMHERKHEFIVANPRTSMEDYLAAPQGHAIQEEAV